MASTSTTSTTACRAPAVELPRQGWHTRAMDSPGDDELAGELHALTRQLRGQLVRHAALGAWAAPGDAMARPVFDEPAAAEAPAVDNTALPFGSAASPGKAGLVEAPIAGDAPARSARTLPQIRDELGECTRCKLHTTRRKIVFGV